MRIRSSNYVNRVVAILGSYLDLLDLYKTADKYYNSLFERVRLFQFIHKQIPALKVELSKLKARVDYYSSLHTSYIARFETAKKSGKPNHIDFPGEIKTYFNLLNSSQARLSQLPYKFSKYED